MLNPVNNTYRNGPKLLFFCFFLLTDRSEQAG